jgi:hypothetical protein
MRGSEQAGKMMHHIPTPHRHVLFLRIADDMSPETQVLIMNGVAGIYEKNKRERSDVVSATITSTRRIMLV